MANSDARAIYFKERQLANNVILNHLLMRALDALAAYRKMTIRPDLINALNLEQARQFEGMERLQAMRLARRVDNDITAIFKGAAMPDDPLHLVLNACHGVVKTAAECKLDGSTNQGIMVAALLLEEAENHDPAGWRWTEWKSRAPGDKMYDLLMSKGYFGGVMQLIAQADKTGEISPLQSTPI